MQPLLQEVLPWVVGFVLLDALVQLRVGQDLVARTWPGRARGLGPGVHLAAAWPHSEVIPAHELPFLPARDGAWFRDPAARGATPVLVPEELTFVLWEDLALARRDGRSVVAVGRTLARAVSPAGAAHLVARLAALAGAGDRREEVAAAQIAEALDPGPLRAYRARTRGLRAALAGVGAAWTLLLAGLLPVAAWTQAGAIIPVLPVLAAGLGLSLVAAVLAAWTLRRAGSGWGAAIARASPLLLFPPLAARALPHVSREAQLPVEPLAALAALACPADVAAACRRERVRVAYSRAATASLGLAAFWDARERAIRALVEGESLAAAVDAAPPRDPAAVCVCPLCEASYAALRESCAECGVALVTGDTRPVRA
jgi:hypothetical protein